MPARDQNTRFAWEHATMERAKGISEAVRFEVGQSLLDSIRITLIFPSQPNPYSTRSRTKGAKRLTQKYLRIYRV